MKFDSCDIMDLQYIHCVLLGRDSEPGAEQKYYVMLVSPDTSGEIVHLKELG